MKKLTFAAAAMALLFCFASCTEKEGVYNPKKKIDKVFLSSTRTMENYDAETESWGEPYTENIDKYQSERWTWDGKTVTKIEYLNTDGSVYSTTNFTYDDNRIVRMENGEEYAVITYDGDKLKAIETHSPAENDEDRKSDGEDVTIFTMIYNGDKISQISVTGTNDMLFKKSQMMTTLCSTIMPKQIDNIFDKARSIVSKKAGKGARKDDESAINIKLTWTGDNVTKMTTHADMGFIIMDLDITYTFDKKNNPFLHFVNTGIDGFIFLNENNVLTESMVTTYSYSFMGEEGEETETDNITFTYEYDGKWPTSVTSQVQNTYYYDDGEPGERQTETETTYYEYK